MGNNYRKVISTKTVRTLSTAFSVLSIISIIYIDAQIALRYIQANGKTKALFGIIEVLQFNYKHLILLPAILSIVLTFKILKSKEFKIWDACTLIVSIVAIIATVTSSWRLLI